ncbi:hypothetical protein I3679_003970 [Proteus mirabilis]|uniref:Transporter n=1 Tax=Proteus mirabilis TaxID=584 RepID=A0ABD5LWG0_PROMI
MIYTVIILPFTIMIISGAKQGKSILQSLLNAISQPLVFLPILGLC